MRTNPPLRTAILAIALVVFFALPSVASAGQVVPPGNSAATQYTQVFPTSGGNVAVGTSIGETGNGGKKSASKVIGEKTAKELESQGSEGEAVAQLAVESAPETTTEPEPSEGSGGGATAGGDGPKHDRGSGGEGSGNGGNDGKNQAGAKANQGGGGPQAAPSGDDATLEAAGSGSSGFSEVLGQATGADSGQMGVFLPLVLIAALVLALLYAWRRRHHEPETLP